MAPKKLASQRGVGESQRAKSGGESQRGTNRGGESQRGKKGGSPMKKAASKKRGGLDAVAEGEGEVALEPVAELVVPVQAFVEEMRVQVKEVEAKLATVKEGYSAEESGAPAAVEPAAPTLSRTQSMVQRDDKALRVWKSFASKRLSEMASSLDVRAARISTCPVFSSHQPLSLSNLFFICPRCRRR